MESTRMKILAAEDDRKILSFVRKGLTEQGFTVDTTSNGDEAFLLATTRPYDVLLLDIMMPGRDGLSVLRGLRELKNTVPVILLTARSAVNERVEGLQLGADDYLTKPFYMEELIARLHAVVRRHSGEQLSVLRAGEVTINLLTRAVERGGQRLELTMREFALLELFVRSPGRVFPRTQLLEHVWGYDFDPETNVVDVCVRRVRGKLDVGDGPSLIETVRGVGYRLRREGEPA